MSHKQKTGCKFCGLSFSGDGNVSAFDKLKRHVRELHPEEYADIYGNEKEDRLINAGEVLLEPAWVRDLIVLLHRDMPTQN